MTDERKPRVLHLTHHFAPCIGGVERIVEELCGGLAKDGFVSDVACLNRCANSSSRLAAKEKINGINVYRFPFLDLKYYKFAPAVYWLFGEYDVLHVHGLGFFSDFALLTRPLHKKPVVLSTHGGISHTEKLSAVKGIYFNLWARALLGGVGAVCACSAADEEMFKKISSRVVLMENGVNVEKYLKLGARKKPAAFLYVGRLSRNKQIELLLKTFAEFRPWMPGFKLSIVGGDWEGIRKELEGMAAQLGIAENVEFAGAVSERELLKRFAEAKFFVSASRHEGFGISAVEAMAAGCVPILNRIPAFERFVQEGESGFIVDFSEPALTAKKLSRIALARSSDLARVAKNAREQSKQYSWPSRVAGFKKLYEKVVQR